MVDSSGSSRSSSSSENEASRKDSGRAFAKRKIRKRKNIDRYDNDAVVDIDLVNSSDTKNDATLVDGDDQKISPTLPCTVGPYDVICGRNKTAFNNIGNRRFRFTVALALPRFLSAKSRKEKSIVIESIKQLIHQNGGRFLMMPNDEEEDVVANSNSDHSTAWTELDTKQSHLKVGHALRDVERKQAKAKELQQMQLRQQKKETQRRNNVTHNHPIRSTLEGNTMLNVSISDPLLLIRQTGTCDQNEYDTASISTISYSF